MIRLLRLCASNMFQASSNRQVADREASHFRSRGPYLSVEIRPLCSHTTLAFYSLSEGSLHHQDADVTLSARRQHPFGLEIIHMCDMHAICTGCLRRFAHSCASWGRVVGVGQRIGQEVQEVCVCLCA
jgi:hypothetical protein